MWRGGVTKRQVSNMKSIEMRQEYKSRSATFTGYNCDISMTQQRPMWGLVLSGGSRGADRGQTPLWPPDRESASIIQLLCLKSGSASFRGPFEGQLGHSAVRRLSQSEGSSRCFFFSLFLKDALLRSFVASHVPRFFACPKNKKEREKMATSRGVMRHSWWGKNSALCLIFSLPANPLSSSTATRTSQLIKILKMHHSRVQYPNHRSCVV